MVGSKRRLGLYHFSDGHRTGSNSLKMTSGEAEKIFYSKGHRKTRTFLYKNGSRGAKIRPRIITAGHSVDEGELKYLLLITADKKSSQGHLGHNHASRESTSYI